MIHKPTNRFDPHDPHHVTLQLLQEVHSQRIQMQIDRDKERDLRREETERHAKQMAELRGMRSDESFDRDQRERELTAKRQAAEKRCDEQVVNVNKLRKLVREIADLGNSRAAIRAKNEVRRWG